jgi:hypothetical protein
MPVWLTCPRMLARIEKAKKLLSGLAIALQTVISGFNIVFFQHMCLLFEYLGGKNEVVRGYRELVEDEEVSRQSENE